jgi:hypothetical protein
MNKARSMIKYKNMSNDFWVEAIAFSIYILNTYPTKSVKGKVMQIRSLYYFSSILMLLEWKKLEESTCRAILVAGPSLEILDVK